VKRNRIEPSFLALLTAIAALLFLNYRLVLYAQYETDEFLHSAWGGDLHVGIPAYAPEMPGKTRLSLVLFSLPFKMTNRMADILLINRHAVFFVVIASLYVLFLLHGNVFGSRRGALWAVFWTLACTTFIERGFRVRSDMVATAFALVGVHQFLVGRPSVRAWAAGAWMSLAFCTTQKSAYFILSFIVAFWVAYRLAGENALREFSRFALGGLAVFAGYVLAFGRGGNYATVLKTTFFSDLVMDTALGRNYGALAPYYWQTFARNIAFYCLAFAGLGYILRGWRSNPWPQNFLAVFTAVLLGCMTIHREPWPYVFVMVIPFLGCFAGWISEAVLQALRTTDRMVAVPALVLLFTVGVESIVRHVAHFQITCFPQLDVRHASLGVAGDSLPGLSRQVDRSMGYRRAGAPAAAARRAMQGDHLQFSHCRAAARFPAVPGRSLRSARPERLRVRMRGKCFAPRR